MTTHQQLNPVLVLGGTGTVGKRIAQQLASASVPALIASRKANGPNGVAFDWDDPTTWDAPFTAAVERHPQDHSKPQTLTDDGKPRDENDSGIRSVYLIAPTGSSDPASAMMAFVDFARQRGARRFVLQSASCIDSGGPMMGKVHAYLRELGQRGEADWAVLRPTWFQQNLAEQENHLHSIRSESKLYSATGDGKIPWISADDIASVAVQTLTQADPPNTEMLILGPELLSYDDIAEILTSILKRKIVHVDLSSADLEERHQSFGMPEQYARMMSGLDTAIKVGSENRSNDVVLGITGSAARSFREFAESVKDVWAVDARA